jgi:hypothetical protein
MVPVILIAQTGINPKAGSAKRAKPYRKTSSHPTRTFRAVAAQLSRILSWEVLLSGTPTAAARGLAPLHLVPFQGVLLCWAHLGELSSPQGRLGLTTEYWHGDIRDSGEGKTLVSS